MVVHKLVLRRRQSEDLAEYGVDDNILLLPAGPPLFDVAQFVELRRFGSESIVGPEGIDDIQHLGCLLAIEVQNVDRVDDRVTHEARSDIGCRRDGFDFLVGVYGEEEVREDLLCPLIDWRRNRDLRESNVRIASIAIGISMARGWSKSRVEDAWDAFQRPTLGLLVLQLAL